MKPSPPISPQATIKPARGMRLAAVFVVFALFMLLIFGCTSNNQPSSQFNNSSAVSVKKNQTNQTLPELPGQASRPQLLSENQSQQASEKPGQIQETYNQQARGPSSQPPDPTKLGKPVSNIDESQYSSADQKQNQKGLPPTISSSGKPSNAIPQQSEKLPSSTSSLPGKPPVTAKVLVRQDSTTIIKNFTSDLPNSYFLIETSSYLQNVQSTRFWVKGSNIASEPFNQPPGDHIRFVRDGKTGNLYYFATISKTGMLLTDPEFSGRFAKSQMAMEINKMIDNAINKPLALEIEKNLSLAKEKAAREEAALSNNSTQVPLSQQPIQEPPQGQVFNLGANVVYFFGQDDFDKLESGYFYMENSTSSLNGQECTNYYFKKLDSRMDIICLRQDFMPIYLSIEDILGVRDVYWTGIAVTNISDDIFKIPSGINFTVKNSNRPSFAD
ncbi:hypothetical protein FJZ26_00240 [Candidatus Parvarchaeota archaeon]|nr:hypothetical protein [Candidatus Parvarchaeota archaeon]